MALEKTNVSGYLKDTKTKMVLNTNNNEYQQYMTARQRILANNQQEKKIDDLTKQVEKLEALLENFLKKVT